MTNILPVKDKKARKASWPGIKAFFSKRKTTHAFYPAELRKLYIDGILPDVDQKVLQEYQTDLICRLVLEPDSRAEDWDDWNLDLTSNELKHQYALFIGLEHFAQNSFLAGRELEIYDYFFKDIRAGTGNIERIIKIKENKTAEFMGWFLGSLVTLLSKHELNAYSQEWRKAESLTDYLLQSAGNHYDHASDIEKLRIPVCRFEWCVRNLDNYNPLVQSELKKLRAAFDDERTHSIVRESYHATVTREMDSYVESTAAGGRFSVLIEYDTSEQLEAMVPLLMPETRFPFTPETYGKILTPFPNRKQHGPQRVSYNGLLGLWNLGFKADRIEVVNSRTLYVEFTGFVTLSNSVVAIDVLRSNMVKFLEKMNARKVLPEDIEYKTPYFKTLYVVSPVAGRKRVGAVPKGSFLDSREASKEIYEGVDSSVDKLLNSKGESIDILQSLMSDHFDGIMDSGNSIDWKWIR